MGHRPLRRDQAGGRRDDADGTAARRRAVLGEPVPVPAVRLHAPATRPARTWWARRPGRRATGSRSAYPGDASSSCWRRTWPPTRRARTSTFCARAASGSRPRSTIPAAVIRDVMHLTGETMFAARQISNLGGLLSGVNNNGNHSANGIAAMFIATGQDAANVAESSAALVFAEPLRQRRLLLLDHHPGPDRRPPTAAAPACQPSASAWNCSAATARGRRASWPRSWRPPCCAARSRSARAVVADEWVAAHERLGRNRV